MLAKQMTRSWGDQLSNIPLFTFSIVLFVDVTFQPIFSNYWKHLLSVILIYREEIDHRRQEKSG